MMLMHCVVVVVWKLQVHVLVEEEKMSCRHSDNRTILSFVASKLLDEIQVLGEYWVQHVYHTPVRNVAN